MRSEDIDVWPVIKGILNKMKSSRAKSDAYYGMVSYFKVLRLEILSALSKLPRTL